jgi:hypothetical protein
MSGNPVLRGPWWIVAMGLGRWAAVFRTWGARKHSPPFSGGAARWKERQLDCALGANGKGGGGSTAGGRHYMRPLGPSAKVLIRSLPVRSRACRDGRPQYSPRRGLCHLSFSMHRHPIQGRATPLSEGGANLGTLLGFLHSLNSGDGSPEEPCFPIISHPAARLEAAPPCLSHGSSAHCALHGEGCASARPRWTMGRRNGCRPPGF